MTPEPILRIHKSQREVARNVVEVAAEGRSLGGDVDEEISRSSR